MTKHICQRGTDSHTGIKITGLLKEQIYICMCDNREAESKIIRDSTID